MGFKTERERIKHKLMLWIVYLILFMLGSIVGHILAKLN